MNVDTIDLPVANRCFSIPHDLNIDTIDFDKFDVRKKEGYERSVGEVIRVLHVCDDEHWRAGESAGESCRSFLDVMRRLYCRDKPERRLGITNFCGVKYNDDDGIYCRYGTRLYETLLDWAEEEDVLVMLWTGGGPGDGMDMQCRIFNDIARGRKVLYEPSLRSETDEVGLDYCHAAVGEILAHIPREEPNGQSSPLLTVRPSPYLPLRAQMLTLCSDIVSCEPFGIGGSAEDPAVGLDNQLVMTTGLSVIGARPIVFADCTMSDEECQDACEPAGTSFFHWVEKRYRAILAKRLAHPIDYQLNVRIPVDSDPEGWGEHVAGMYIRWWKATQPIREFEIATVRKAIESI